MKSRSIDATSALSMDVLIIVDTEGVKQTIPPSNDPNNPAGIDHKYAYMICTGTRGVISGQGTADLNFKANAGDFVSFYGTSVYGNADDAIIVYNIKYWNGANVFNTFVVDLVERTNAVRPNINTSNGLPAVTGVNDFISLDSRVAKSGTENFYVYFALYTLAADGNTQTLYGYYYWDPTITVTTTTP